MTQLQPQGFLAVPSTGNGPGVLVLHAWWGLNDTIKVFCTRLAESGFVAFAPDLYHGKVVDTIAEADVISRSVFENLDQVRTDVRDAAAYLKELADQATGGLAVIGFSLGAFFALDLSVMAPETTQAVVAFYGTRPGDYSNSKAAYLCHFAETDEFEPPSEVAGLEDALRSANRPATFYHYSGTGHWFFEPDRLQAYNPAAASLAWTRTLAFLQSSFSRETTE